MVGRNCSVGRSCSNIKQVVNLPVVNLDYFCRKTCTQQSCTISLMPTLRNLG